MPNEVADKVAEAIETSNLRRLLVNVNDLRKAKVAMAAKKAKVNMPRLPFMLHR